MEARSPIQADAGILAGLFVIGLSAALPAGALYWLMRPTIVPNPGISAYRTPRPDPVVPLVSRAIRDPYALSIAAAKRENELMHADAKSSFASVQDAEPGGRGVASMTAARQKRQLRARTQPGPQDRSIPAHAPIPPFNSWARDHSFATWYP
jgi:hypothetical protein